MEEMEVDMSFSAELVEKAKPYYEAQLQKRFLVELGSGDLPLDVFRYFVKVDYAYLVNHVHVWSLAVAKSDRPGTMRVLARQLDRSLNDEIPLLESYAGKFGISQRELHEQRMGPLKYAYARHQVAAGYRESLGELMAAALPCKLGFGEIGRALVERYPITPDNPYKDWLALYSSEEEESLALKLLEIFDRLADGSSESQLRRMEENFIIGMQYETMLWDEYYRKGGWETP
jgi:thiaminase/transcriptional activator TenA